MSGRNSRTAGAAVAAAPAPVVNQTAETAGEAGLPIVPTGQGDTATETEAESTPESEAEPLPFNAVVFAESVGQLNETDFDAAFAVMVEEAKHRGIIGYQPEDEEDEEEEEIELDDETDEDEEEHAETRELLQRFKLPRAWQDAQGGIHFDEASALKAAGENPDSLTVIEA